MCQRGQHVSLSYTTGALTSCHTTMFVREAIKWEASLLVAGLLLLFFYSSAGTLELLFYVGAGACSDGIKLFSRRASL